MPDWDPRPDNFFTSLAGVPVAFDRLPPRFPYGKRVDLDLLEEQYQFHCRKSFQNKLEKCFSELWTVCPLGKAEQILSAGTWVAKPLYHGRGRAFDLDGICWSSRTFVTLRYHDDERFYLAIEAVLRKHFGIVLNYYYPGHKDHFHVDDGDAPGFSPGAHSECLFVSMALDKVLNIPTPITREYEPLRKGLHKANAGDLKKVPTWMRFLDRIAQSGFAPLDV